MAEHRVLLTVSGRVPDDLADDVAAGRRPRADYLVLAEAFGADIADLDVAVGAGRAARAMHRVVGTGPTIAWWCWRHRRSYDVLVTDGEQVGIPYALLCRVLGRGRMRHAMIVHILSVPKKAWLMRVTRIAGLIDRYVVYSTAQRRFIVDWLGVEPDHVVLSPFMVDTRFFDPTAVDVEPRRMICSAGLERRDYPTLMEAVGGLDLDVVIAAASPWSKQSDSSAGRPLPTNVEVKRLSLSELRDLYAQSLFVVMPLHEVDFQAGITTILEAMSMARPVVCTRTSGQTDAIADGETGIYVPPGDVEGLRAAIVQLLSDGAARLRYGHAARRWAVEHADVAIYAERLADIVRSLRTEVAV